MALKCVWTSSILFDAKRGPLKTSVSKKTARSDDISHVNLIMAWNQSGTQSPRAFWPAGERPERLWDNRLHFPRKRGFRSYDVWLSLNGSRKEKTVNSRNGGLKVFEEQEF